MTNKIISEQHTIQTNSGLCDVYISRPDADKPVPAVLLIMDAFGPRKYLYSVADKLAEEGYFVLLPNIFYRQKKAPMTSVTFPLTIASREVALKEIMPLILSYRHEFILQDMSAFFDFLAQQKNVQSRKIGITGYCMGGALALRIAADQPSRVAAVASFHAGHLVCDETDSPHLLLNQIQAEIYVAHADHDDSMPLEDIKKFSEAIKNHHGPHKAEVYHDALHGFTMADLPAHNPEALKRHWQELLALLKRNL